MLPQCCEEEVEEDAARPPWEGLAFAGEIERDDADSFEDTASWCRINYQTRHDKARRGYEIHCDKQPRHVRYAIYHIEKKNKKEKNEKKNEKKRIYTRNVLSLPLSRSIERDMQQIAVGGLIIVLYRNYND